MFASIPCLINDKIAAISTKRGNPAATKKGEGIAFPFSNMM
jgi:hypothetical protein